MPVLRSLGIPDDAGQRLEVGGEDQAPHLYDEQSAAGTMQGVYLFKRGFGGTVARTVGAYDYLYAPARYWLWTRGLPAARSLAAWATERFRRSDGGKQEPAAREAYET
ncbi:MAG: peptidoglycan bridge formation glycyltransferase FemA/FemB family protein [Dehalococcoidales bacterium]|nr:peptidoglycan bridge formation glycyltransferase FemA/FemB family protein [Dehalococcoidales bacterium]